MRPAVFRLALIAAALAATPALAQEETIPPVQMDVPPTPQSGPVVLPVTETRPPAIPEVWSPVPRDANDRSAYGLYLAGRMAMSRGEASTASTYLGAAEALTPEQPTVRQQAFISAMFGGDLGAAARTAPDGEDAPPVLSQAGRLIDVVVLFGGGDAGGALAALQAEPVGQPHARAGAYVEPFIAAAAGETLVDDLPAGGRNPDLLFMRYHLALVLEATGRADEAEAVYRRLVATAPGSSLFRQPWAEFLERRGKRDEAIALYRAAGDADPLAAAALARIERRGRPPAALNLRQGAAHALGAAAIQASIEGAHEFAALYLRLALTLDPSDELQLRLGETLAEAQLEVAAREALAAVDRSDPLNYAAARAGMAMSLERDGESEEALAELRLAHAAAPANPQIAYLLAAQLTQLERYDEAIALLNGPVLNQPEQGFEIHFLRGAAYESRGDIVEAEAELWAALQARPDDPSALNYLGYLWVDSGRRVDQGAEMIARAFAADPENGNIQDSLGWAQYRQGQYETAVATLEAAVDKEPANAEINDHLGDAYWQVGRRREARFQWTRVLSLEPDAQRRAEAERKLAEGLATAVPVGASPAG